MSGQNQEVIHGNEARADRAQASTLQMIRVISPEAGHALEGQTIAGLHTATFSFCHAATAGQGSQVMVD